MFERAQTVSLAFDGSAMHGVDYRSSGAAIVIPAFGRSGSSEVTIRAVDDGRAEGDETIVVTAELGSIPLGTATITIDDDDNGPTAIITSSAEAPVGGAFEVSIAFGASVFGFGVGDLEVSGGEASDLTGNGAEYTAHVTPQAAVTGEVSVLVPAGVARDASDNWNLASPRFAIAADTIAPAVSVSSDAAAPVAGPFEVSIKFSEPVSGLDLGGLRVENGEASDLAGGGAEYTASIMPSSGLAGEVSVLVPAGVARDASDNWNLASPRFAIAADTMAPAVSVSSDAAEPVAGPFEVSITFSEPVSGLDLGGLRVENGEASDLAGSGAEYTVRITPSPGFEGVVSVSVMAGGAMDAAGNANLESPRCPIVADMAAPTVLLSTAARVPVAGAFEVSITFSEPVSGLDVSGLRVVNGEAADLSGSEASYSATVTPAPGLRGEVSVEVVAGAASDAAGNRNSASPLLTVAAYLNDPPVFDEEAYAFDLPENSPGPLPLGRVSAVDPNEGDRLSYEILGSEGEFFAVGSDGGLTYEGPGEDYESGPPSYAFRVRAADGDGLTAAADVLVTVSNRQEEGSVELSTLLPEIGAELSARLTDEDGDVVDERWRWQRSNAAAWEDIPGAASPRYVPRVVDIGLLLRAVVGYTDAAGPGQEAVSVATERVMIPPREREGAMRAALAGIARMLASNTVDAIESRLEAGGVGVRSHATVYGHRLPLGSRPGQRTATGQSTGFGAPAGFGLSPGFGASGSFGGGFGSGGWAGGGGAGGGGAYGSPWATGPAGGMGAVPGAGFAGAGMSMPGFGGLMAGSGQFALGQGFGYGRRDRRFSAFWELASRSSFEIPLRARGAAGPGSVEQGRDGEWTFWGRGDRGNFRGSVYSVDGETGTFYIGVDRRRGENVLGLALSTSRGRVDYASELAGEGELDIRLTSLIPYGRWSLGKGRSVWALLGAGGGESALSDAQDERLSTDLTRELVAGGARQELGSRSGYSLALKGDLFATRLRTRGNERLGSVSAEAYRGRILLEGRTDWSLSEHSRLTPTVEVGGRFDGGTDSVNGLGAEIGGRLKYSNSARGLDVEARGRYIAAHQEDGFAAWGAGLTVRVGAGEGGAGFGATLTPTWGEASAGVGSLWRSDGMLLPVSGGGYGNDLYGGPDASPWMPGRSEVRLQYGLRGLRGLLTPFAALGMEGDVPGRAQVGVRFDRAESLRLELAAERLQRRDGAADLRAGFGLVYVVGGRRRVEPGVLSASEGSGASDRTGAGETQASPAGPGADVGAVLGELD